MDKMRNKRLPFRALIEGLFLSAGLSLFLYYGISVVYEYLPGSVLALICLTFFCFLIFWLNIKYDCYLDVNEVFYKTIAVDFKADTPGAAGTFSRFVRRINPYFGFTGTISVLLVLLLGIPALVIYLAIHPEPYTGLLKTCVLSMDIVMCIVYFFLAGKKFPSIAEKAMFFTGILLGSAGIVLSLPF